MLPLCLNTAFYFLLSLNISYCGLVRTCEFCKLHIMMLMHGYPRSQLNPDLPKFYLITGTELQPKELNVMLQIFLTEFCA